MAEGKIKNPTKMRVVEIPANGSKDIDIRGGDIIQIYESGQNAGLYMIATSGYVFRVYSSLSSVTVAKNSGMSIKVTNGKNWHIDVYVLSL